jgi:hypothetical protein
LAAAVFVAYFAALAAVALKALDAAFQAWQTCARGWDGSLLNIFWQLRDVAGEFGMDDTATV